MAMQVEDTAPGDEDAESARAHSTRLWSVGSAGPLLVTELDVEAVPASHLRLWTVVYSVLTTCLLAILVGATIAFSSPAVLELKQLEDPELRFDILLLDIFGASTFIGGIFGAPIGGVVADRFGRKTSLILNSFPLVSGYFILLSTYLVSNGVMFKVLLMVGRFLTGIGAGWVYLAAPVYIGEISPHNLRGAFAIFSELSVVGGILLALGLGAIPGFRYYHSALVFISCTALFITLAVWIPETPRWLLLRQKDEPRAMAALRCLRGPKYTKLNQEIDDIKATIAKKSPGFLKLLKELLTERSTLIPFLLILFLYIYQRTGIDVVSAYAGPIFLEAGVPNPNLTATFAVGGVKVLVTILTILLVEFAGRKILLAVSSAGMFLGAALLGVHFYITRPGLCANDTLPTGFFMEGEVSCNPHLFPLAIVGVVVFNLGFAIGIGPVPWVMLSEYLPSKVRGVAGGIVVGANWATASLFVGSFLSYSEAFGPWTAWWTLAAINLMGFLVVVLFFVETKGKKLEEVQELFRTGHCCVPTCLVQLPTQKDEPTAENPGLDKAVEGDLELK